MSFDLPAFTLIHVLLSILGIISGLVIAGAGSATFGVTQLFVLALFVGMGWAAVKGFRAERG